MRKELCRRRRLQVYIVLMLLGAAGTLARGEDVREDARPAGELIPVSAEFPAEKGQAGKEAGDEKKKAPPYEAESQSPKEFPFATSGSRMVYVAPMKGVVDLGIGPFLTRVFEEAEANNAAAVILELDTPGGRVDAAVEIKDLLLRAKVPTIAFVNKQAISAGALIAYAHDYIIWADGGTMGAATPIQLGGGGEAQPVEEKMTSYMRGVMRATAEANGRDGLVAEAMVDASIELTGFAPKDKLLTATEKQAEALGLLDGRADSIEELLQVIGLGDAQIIRPQVNWAEQTARFLTHPVVSSILMSIGMLGLILEFYTPGFGLAGIVGAIALFLFFAGHLVVHLAGLLEIMMVVAGIVLIFLELFIIPGFGLPGVLGVLLICASLILALVGLDWKPAWDSGLIGDAIFRFSLAAAGAGIAVVLILRYVPGLKPIRALILEKRLDDKEGYTAREATLGDKLMGREGVALTDLHPGGRARIDGVKYDVTAHAEYIPKGASVRVIAVDGPRIGVEHIPEQEEKA